MSQEGHTSRLVAALSGRYRIERKLGEGGMASVYLAEDIKHQRKVALKILRPELAAVIGADRFLTEIRTTANLQHPHILALFDSGEAEGISYGWSGNTTYEGEAFRAWWTPRRDVFHPDFVAAFEAEYDLAR